MISWNPLSSLTFSPHRAYPTSRRPLRWRRQRRPRPTPHPKRTPRPIRFQTRLLTLTHILVHPRGNRMVCPTFCLVVGEWKTTCRRGGCLWGARERWGGVYRLGVCTGGWRSWVSGGGGGGGWGVNCSCGWLGERGGDVLCSVLEAGDGGGCGWGGWGVASICGAYTTSNPATSTLSIEQLFPWAHKPFNR